MRYPVLLAPAMALLLLNACSRTSAPVAREDKQNSVNDYGVEQYTFQGRARSGQVLVFRGERYINGKLSFRLDNVSSPGSGDVLQRVKLLDLARLGVPDSGDKFILTSPVGGMDGNTYLTGTSFDMPNARMEFDFKYSDNDPFNAGKEVKFVYTMFTESQESAAKRIPALAAKDPTERWGYSQQYHFDK